MTVIPVILCGGSGTRLWPLSRALYPKQLLTLTGETSLLQETWLRLRNARIGIERPIVVCNEAQRFLVREQLRTAGADPQVVLEPEGRNTAPAAALAALLAERSHGRNTLLLVLPSDHVIRDATALGAAVAVAIDSAAAGQLVTFGVMPDRPETGYGYIRARPGSSDVRAVEQFVEKPDYATAERYLREGGYFWNSGMFLFSAGRYLEELDRHAPGILASCRQALEGMKEAGGYLRLNEALFRACPADSIDYAVMEAGWSDVGSWAALGDVSAQDGAGNTQIGDVIAIDCKGSYLRSESRLVAAVGLEDCIVVETKDAVLVAPRDRAQDVKSLVDELKKLRRPEATVGREVFRPWGSYDSLDEGAGFQVKRLVVLPGAVLSLQLHHRRAEHWVVVTGTARITRDDEVFELRTNQHTHIPVGARHRIENTGPDLLQIIEVQIGDYLGEDDIVRFEDKYGRQGRTD
jgi:mannose-1-phosphate guanylyltransferase/mannose-6-phosphate isomerase